MVILLLFLTLMPNTAAWKVNKTDINCFQCSRCHHLLILNVAGPRGLARRNAVEHRLKHERCVRVHFIPCKTTISEADMVGQKRHPGEVLLVRSHAHLYRRLIKSGKEYAIVGEDDIAVISNFSVKLDHVLDHLPDDYDYVKLEWCTPWDPQSTHVDPQSNVMPTISPGQGGACSALYIVSSDGAKLLLDINPPLRPLWNADGAMDINNVPNPLRPLRAYHVEPPMAWQDKSYAVQKSGGHAAVKASRSRG